MAGYGTPIDSMGQAAETLKWATIDYPEYQRQVKRQQLADALANRAAEQRLAAGDLELENARYDQETKRMLAATEQELARTQDRTGFTGRLSDLAPQQEAPQAANPFGLKYAMGVDNKPTAESLYGPEKMVDQPQPSPLVTAYGKGLMDTRSEPVYDERQKAAQVQGLLRSRGAYDLLEKYGKVEDLTSKIDARTLKDAGDMLELAKNGDAGKQLAIQMAYMRGAKPEVIQALNSATWTPDYIEMDIGGHPVVFYKDKEGVKFAQLDKSKSGEPKDFAGPRVQQQFGTEKVIYEPIFHTQADLDRYLAAGAPFDEAHKYGLKQTRAVNQNQPPAQFIMGPQASFQQGITGPNGEMMAYVPGRGGQPGTLVPVNNPADAKKRPTEETINSGATLKTLQDVAGDIIKDPNLKNIVGPVKGRWTNLKSKFVDTPEYSAVDQKVGTLLETAYALSGKQISEKEMATLKEKFWSDMNAPKGNFDTKMAGYMQWLERKAKAKSGAFTRAGYANPVPSAQSSTKKPLSSY